MLTSDSNQIKERFNVELMLFDAPANHNIAPTQIVPVVINSDVRTLDGFRWGLVPRWAKDLSVGSRMINARAETLNERPSFKPAFAHRRCLIPANGFYEWVKKGDSPGPRLFELPERELLAFAGLWESWQDPQGANIHTCTIITTNANKYVEPVHERMPVILRPEDEELWLSKSAGLDDLLGLLATNQQMKLTATPVAANLTRPIS